MSIIINLHPILQSYASNQVTVEVKGSTVGECLNDLVRQFPRLKPMLFNKQGGLFNYVDVFVNRESAYPEELAKPVKDGDEVYIAIIIAGG